MCDLINREYAIKKLCESCGDECPWGTWTCNEKSILKELPSAQQWIPCSERLPEMYDKKLLGNYDNSNAVIITYKDNGRLCVSECCIVYCSDGKWRYLNESGSHEMNDDLRVIAWMPLPEPYKGGDTE